METRRLLVILGGLRRVALPIYSGKVSFCNFSCTKM